MWFLFFQLPSPDKDICELTPLNFPVFTLRLYIVSWFMFMNLCSWAHFSSCKYALSCLRFMTFPLAEAIFSISVFFFSQLHQKCGPLKAPDYPCHQLYLNPFRKLYLTGTTLPEKYRNGSYIEKCLCCNREKNRIIYSYF